VLVGSRDGLFDFTSLGSNVASVEGLVLGLGGTDGAALGRSLSGIGTCLPPPQTQHARDAFLSPSQN